MSTSARPSWPTSLGAAWGAITADPVGVLLPASALLLLDLFATVTVWQALDGPHLLRTVGVVWIVRAVLGAVLRSRLIASGARAMRLPTAPWGRPLALLGVEIATAPVRLLVGGVVAVPLVVSAIVIGAHGSPTAGVAVGGLVAVGAAAGALAVRVAAAYAPAEVVLGGRSAVEALASSVAAARADLVGVTFLVLAGDLLVAAGALLCGAGALAGYPITELALLHRWRDRQISGRTS